MTLCKLVSDKGRWATQDLSMIFCNVVWLEKSEMYKYKLIKEDSIEEIPLEKPMEEYLEIVGEYK